MKEENLKDIWKMINEQAVNPESIQHSPDQFSTNRSGSIQNKIRRMLQNDLLVKAIAGLAFIMTLLMYLDTQNVIYICIIGILFMAIMLTIEVNLLKQFNKIADPGQATRDSLSGLLTFLKRKSHLFEITLASTHIMIFIPGLLLYFFAVYGQVRPMNLLDYFVFSVLVLIVTIFSFVRIGSQIKFHIRHITACLSDLNENTLQFVSDTIERQRKQDDTIKVLVALLLIFGFVALLAVLKAIVSLPV